MAIPFVGRNGIPFLILFIAEGNIKLYNHQFLEDVLETIPEEGIDIRGTG